MSRKYIFSVTVHPNVLDKAIAWCVEETVWATTYGMWPTSNLYKCFLVTKHPKYKYQMENVRFIISISSYDSMDTLYSTNKWTLQQVPIWRHDQTNYPLYQSLVAPTAYGLHSVLQLETIELLEKTQIVFRSDQWKAHMRCDVHACIAKKQTSRVHDPRSEFDKHIFSKALSEPPCEGVCESFFREWMDTQDWSESESSLESGVSASGQVVGNAQSDSHVQSHGNAKSNVSAILHPGASLHLKTRTNNPHPINTCAKHMQQTAMLSARQRPNTQSSVLSLISMEDELYAHYQVRVPIRWNWQCTVGNDRTIRDLTNVLDRQTSMYCLFVVETERRDQMLMGYIKLSYPNFAVQTILREVSWIGDKRVQYTPVSKDEYDEAIRVTQHYEAQHTPKIPQTLASGQCLSLLHAPIFHSRHSLSIPSIP